MKQKVLAILLSVVMLLGMLPVGIIAGANGDATEPTLPAGTVGYVMDVPETEQFINWKNSDTGVLYFNQWHANFLMNNNAANAADPFNAKSYPSSSGGLYVKNLGGEGYMVWNPREVYTSAGSTEYADGTNNVNTAYGTINASNGKIFWNNISALENSDFTANAVGLVAIDDADESGITHLALRIKVIGGIEGQKSVFHIYDTNGNKIPFGYTTTYFLDINTGVQYANQTTDTVIILPEGDFDGYMVLPVTAEALAKLQTTEGMHIYTFAAGSTYHKESNWEDRCVCFGDAFAVNDEDAFCAQYVPVSTAPADSSKNLMTVPGEGGFISYNNSSSYGSGKDWGLSRWSTSETKCTFPDGSSKYVFACMSSVTENGENFFKSYVNTTANFASTGVATIKGTFSPATYELNIAYDSAPEQTFTALHADATDYGYIGIRFKTTGTSANGASTIGLYVGTGSGDMTIAGTKVYNYKTGEITTVASGAKTFSVPDNFDGWFFLPSGINDTAVRVGINLKQNSATDNWDDKTIYVGDMKLVKSVDTFLAVNGAPAFTVTPAANDKLVVSNTVDAEKAALYTVDGENWYNIDAFNALTLEGSKYYTITARYPWGVEAATISKTVFNAVDTATMLLPAEGVLYCPGYNYGTYGLGWASSKTMRNSDNSGWSVGDSNNYLWSTTLDGERYWEVCDNPAVTGCRQFTIYPLFKKTVGEVYANAAEKYSHLAIRVRLEEDGTGTAVEGATYPVSLNLFGPGGKDAHYDRWSRIGGVYFYDITTGETTEVTSVSQNIPLGFNGYLIFPSNAVYYGDLVEGDDPSTTSKVEESYYTNFRYGDISLMDRFHVYMHNPGDGHYSSETGNWTGVTLYLGDMELVEDDKAFLDVRTNCDYSGVHTLVAVEAAAPSAENNGHIAHYACTQCGATYADAEGTTPVNPTLLTFDAASLTLEQNITVNFKVNAENLAGLTDVYAKVNFGTREAIIEAGEAVDGKYVFNFDEVGPHNFGTTITAQLFGTYEGTEYEGEIVEYSVKDYCYNKLAEYADATDKDEFKTLLVDLLNYGAKAQTYTGTDASNLVNAGLKYSDRIFGTITPPTVNTGVRGVYDEIDETVTWNGVNLYFEDKASLKFRFTAASTEGLTVKVMDAKSGGNVLAEITEFKAGENGSSVALFNKLDATMMRDTVYVAVYNGETQVSEILAYSVVAYAGQKVIVNSESTTAQKNLAALVSHMIRYGDAAVAYAAANA